MGASLSVAELRSEGVVGVSELLSDPRGAEIRGKCT